MLEFRDASKRFGALAALDGCTFAARPGRIAVGLGEMVDGRYRGATPHDLRHAAASFAIASGASVKGVQSMLGHASATQTLDRYAALWGDELDAVADRIDAARVEVAEVDWAEHIPKLIDFWCRVLLGHPGYDGFVLSAHRDVHDIEAFAPELFDRWYLLFVACVDGGWKGPKAEQAKIHAARIAATLARRLLDVDWHAPGTRSTSTADAVALVPTIGRTTP